MTAALVSLLGMALLVGTALLMSRDRRAIQPRTVAGAFLIQIGLGALVLYIPFGIHVLDRISHHVQQVLDCGNAGIRFLFGEGEFVFAFNVLPSIIFFASLIAVLYHLGIMTWIIKILGGGLSSALGTSRTESLAASANIFVGLTEAPLVVRPYIPRMTQSELFAVMVGGLASIAGSVLAAYAAIGVELKYLLAASFMAAPGGLLFAKLVMPETGTPNENLMSDETAEGEERPVNLLDAAATGATNGLKLALNVGAMLLAFISLIALLNLLIGGIGSWFGQDAITIEKILGYLFAPLAWILGVPWSEAMLGGSIIGQKFVLNELVAYTEFISVRDALSPRSQAIITFALCGFANLASIAVLLGGLGGMAPSRRPEIARLGFKAVIAGSLANFMSAAIAGFFLSLQPVTDEAAPPTPPLASSHAHTSHFRQSG